MNRMGTAAILSLVLAGTSHAMEVMYGAKISDDPAQPAPGMDSIGAQVSELKDAIADPALSQQDLHAQAAAMWNSVSAMPAVPAVRLGGWEKPDRSSRSDIEGMMSEMQTTLARSWSDNREPPAPELLEAYKYGDSVRAAGRAEYDKGEVLKDSQLGAYVFSKAEALGIYFNKAFRNLQQALGDGFAAATAVHESAHARDHAKGRLNAVEVRAGEKLAFKTEYLWLQAFDPSGQKLAWARHNFCGADAASDPQNMACRYLQHLAQIKDYASRDDYDGLVAKLGYKDRDRDPLAAQPAAEGLK
jgi:hypothetical protein